MQRYSWYSAGNSFLHRANPATKIIFLLLAYALAFFFQNPVFNGPILAVLVALIFLAKVPGHLIKALLIVVLPILIVFSALWPFLFGQGNVLATYPFLGFKLEVTDLGIEWGIALAFRLAVLIFSTFLILATTSEGSLTAGFLKLRIPYVIAFVILLTLRFVNLVAGDIATIQDARKARALPPRQGLTTYIRNTASLLVPLMLVMVRRMQLVTNALDVRGFIPGRKRSNYYALTFSRLDLSLIAVMVIAVIVIGYLRIFQGMFVVIPNKF